MIAWLFTSHEKSGKTILKKKESNLIMTDFLQRNMPHPPPRRKNYSTFFQLVQYCDLIKEVIMRA